jgi:hypothetical protein
MLDSWGVRLVSECYDSLGGKNAEIKIIVDRVPTPPLPDNIHLKTGETSVNIFIFDNSTVLLVEGSNGRGALFNSDIMAVMCSKIFEHEWNADRYAVAESALS